MSIKSVMPPNHHLILCPPLHLLPSVFPSIRIFSNELILCIEKTSWSQILGSPYPIYENLHEQLNLVEPLNIKIVLRINNSPPCKQQKLKKRQQSVEMAGKFLPYLSSGSYLHALTQSLQINSLRIFCIFQPQNLSFFPKLSENITAGLYSANFLCSISSKNS